MSRDTLACDNFGHILRHIAAGHRKEMFAHLSGDAFPRRRDSRCQMRRTPRSYSAPGRGPSHPPPPFEEASYSPGARMYIHRLRRYDLSYNPITQCGSVVRLWRRPYSLHSRRSFAYWRPYRPQNPLPPSASKAPLSRDAASYHKKKTGSASANSNSV